MTLVSALKYRALQSLSEVERKRIQLHKTKQKDK